MDAVEFETLLHDVDSKLDRLKALYEQWFQGMERLEPTIARKELDRRVALLRKEIPRSTALRFRFQQFVMRYTTLQTYWSRIARQIEEGTYRRDLLKARNAMLASRGARKVTTPEHAFDVEVEVDAVEEAFDANAAQLARPHALRSDAQAPTATPAPPPRAVPLAPTPAATPAPPPRAVPLAPTPAATPAQRPLVSPVAPPPAAPPAAAAAPRLVSPFARAATRAPGAPTQLPPSPAIPAAPVIPGAPRVPVPAAPPPAAAAPPATSPRPAPSPGPQPAAPVVATFARPSVAPTAAASNSQAAVPIPAATVTRPVAAKPAAPQPAESLSDQEVRRVYERYAEARRKNNEPSVSFDAVAKNLRDAAPKMREKYGKPVDFEVVVKDGKVGLKPVPKG